MINDLIKLATHLDNKGLHKEADYVDAIVRKAAEEYTEEQLKHFDGDGDGEPFEDEDFEELRGKEKED